MAGIKGQKKGIKTGGRQKGTPNKLSLSVKDNVLQVFNKIGGVQGMVNWAATNPSEFYKIYAKLLPTDVEVDVAGKLVIEWQKPE